MKAWTLIWTVLAAAALIGVLCGATHQIITLGVSLAMCLGVHAESKKDEDYGNNR